MRTRSLELSCRELAILLCHPQADYLSVLNNLIDSDLSKKSTKYLRAFRDGIADLSPFELQELYTRTFDLNPMCSPALSVHLFGVESFKRSHLMVGLLDMYRIADYPVSGESADHMSTVVRFLPFAENDAREEVAQFILLPGMAKIAEFLDSKSNPFSYLMKATISVVAAETGKEATYA
ncbi:MAG: molecular chaperone TorD family protein [bacterium]|nr:molecular chaperone TorD family protein [bacterium]